MKEKYIARYSALDMKKGKEYEISITNEGRRAEFIDDAGDERHWNMERFERFFEKAPLSPDEEFRNALLQL